MATPVVAYYDEDGLYSQSQQDFEIDYALESAMTMHQKGIVFTQRQREWLICLGYDPDTMEPFDEEQGGLPSEVIEETSE